MTSYNEFLQSTADAFYKALLDRVHTDAYIQARVEKIVEEANVQDIDEITGKPELYFELLGQIVRQLAVEIARLACQDITIVMTEGGDLQDGADVKVPDYHSALLRVRTIIQQAPITANVEYSNLLDGIAMTLMDAGIDPHGD